MNTKKNWTKVTLVVVLALSSLSSVALAAPAAAPVCGGVDTQASLDQIQAAIEWAENGGEVPATLSQDCDEGLESILSFAGYGGESWDRFVQYAAAIEGNETELGLNAAPTGRVATHHDQITAAIEWAESGGAVPSILSEGSGEVELGSTFAGYGGESWARFEQYMAAIEGSLDQ